MTFRPKLTQQQIRDAIAMQSPNMVLDEIKYRKPNAHPEADIQAGVVKWLAMQYPNVMVNANLSGHFKGHMFAQIRAKKSGVTAGMPDLCLICPGGKVVWMEVKSEKGVLSDAQKYVHAKLATLGHNVYVIRSVEDARMAMKMEV